VTTISTPQAYRNRVPLALEVKLSPDAMTAVTTQPYWLYLLECEGGVYYTGIALDVEQRFYQHLFGVGAKFTRARPPLRVLAAQEYPNKSEALRAEIRLKALAKAGKIAFFSKAPAQDEGVPVSGGSTFTVTP
jgi:putative endonuclease